MSADNYALIGIHPLAGSGLAPTTLHGVYVGFMSNEYRPSSIPMASYTFKTHEEALTYANELETEYGLSFLCSCTEDGEQVSTTKKTVRQVIAEYADTLHFIYSARTAGDFSWKGLLYEFMEEIASTEDE